jgi:hypothetical protein
LKEAVDYYSQALAIARSISNRRQEGILLGDGDIVKSCGLTPHWRRTPMGCA